MEYRTLENTTSSCIYEAFMQAFSDYQVSVDIPLEAFEKMLNRNGYMPNVSVGAFANEELVGFILNGVRDWKGEKRIYDLGTAVIPSFRRTGITGRLLDLVRSLCKENHISAYQLEVIQDNKSAVSVYKKQGFQVSRMLNCYRQEEKEKETGKCTKWKLCHPERMCAKQWALVESFWNYPPTWQNAIDAVCAIADSFSYTLAEYNGELIGYGIVDKTNGDIVQLAVHPEYRRMGVATDILMDLQEQTKSSGMRVINVDERDEILNAFLKKMGFEIYVKQYEMINLNYSRQYKCA